MANLKNTTINDTGYITIPCGTIAQRPGSPTAGMYRYNTELGCSEFYNGTNWIDPTTGNPPFVTNGLVLNLDAGNLKSYPGSGTVWYDLSGSGLSASGLSPITGGALSDTQPYTTASTSILNNDNHTILFMIQINGTNGAWSKIFGYTPPGTDRSPGIWRYPSQRYLHWRYDPNNSGADFGPSNLGGPGAEFNINTWYYVGVTKAGSVATSYVNGVSLGTQTVSNPKTAGTSTIQLYPAYNQGTSKMALIHIYNRALSASEVLQNFNSIRGRYGL